MIVQLTGTLIEGTSTHIVLDVGGVGYELGVSSNTAAELPQVGEAGVTVYTRLITGQDSLRLYGFATTEERALFDHLITIPKVGPKVALSVLSTYTPEALATIVADEDTKRMSRVPGVGSKTAQRMVLELQGVFAKDAELSHLGKQFHGSGSDAEQPTQGSTAAVMDEVKQALLSMGFTSREIELVLNGYDTNGEASAKDALSYALKRLGGHI